MAGFAHSKRVGQTKRIGQTKRVGQTRRVGQMKAWIDGVVKIFEFNTMTLGPHFCKNDQK